MNINGEPYIPPHPLCPAEREGNAITPRPDDFMWVVDSSEVDEIKAWGVFADSEEFGDDTDLVRTAEISVPSDTEQAYAVYHGEDHDRELGKMFCDRILNCQGVTEGNCWALGPEAVRTVISELAQKHEL